MVGSMKRKKRTILLVVFLAICLNVTCFIGISAYSMAKDMAMNRVKIGNNTVTITENFVPPDELKPGIAIKKQVVVTNTGKVPCVVRVYAEFTNQDIKKFASLDFNSTDWALNQDGYYYYKKPLNVGEKTSPLFNEIKIADSASQADLENFDVLVYAESLNATMEDQYSSVWGISL